MLVNRRRHVSSLPVLPSLTVDVIRGADRLRPIHARVERLTADTVVIACENGVDALAVTMSPDLELTFRGPGLDVTMRARPGRRVDDIHGSRSVELVLDHDGREVRLIG